MLLLLIDKKKKIVNLLRYTPTQEQKDLSASGSARRLPVLRVYLEQQYKQSEMYLTNDVFLHHNAHCNSEPDNLSPLSQDWDRAAMAGSCCLFT